MHTAMKLPGIRKSVTTTVAAVVVAALSLPAFAAPRHSGGRSAPSAHSAGHAGWHAGGGHHSGRHSGGTRYPGPRIGIYLGAPLVAATAYYRPRYYYPPAYVVAPPAQVFYYCAAYNDYYPRVPVCPSGWQRVIQPPVAPYY